MDSLTFRHRRSGCSSICAVFFGSGRPTFESVRWRIWSPYPLPHWERPTSDFPMATCPDCWASFVPLPSTVAERRAGVDVDKTITRATHQSQHKPRIQMTDPKPVQSDVDPTSMKEYRCHKIVRAAKINAVDGRRVWVYVAADPSLPADTLSIGAFDAPDDWIAKHRPEAGMYLVIYEDGYRSVSPAAAFESGYTELGRNAQVARLKEHEKAAQAWAERRWTHEQVRNLTIAIYTAMMGTAMQGDKDEEEEMRELALARAEALVAGFPQFTEHSPKEPIL